MSVEPATYIADLNPALPPSADQLAEGDDHIRLIKAALLATFPSLNGPCAVTDEILSALGGGGVSLADGNSGAPTLRFTSEPTLGFYRTAAGIMAIAGRLRGNGAVPTGAIMDFARTSALPIGWLECNGAAVSRTTYADLFANIGTFYGAGDGTNTFNLPNMLDRFRRSRGTYALGDVQADQVGSHTHTGTTGASGTHTHGVTSTGTTDAAGDHSHYTFRGTTTFGVELGSDPEHPPATNVGGTGDVNYVMRTAGAVVANVGRTSPSGTHTHPVTVNSTAAAGGDHTHTFTTDVNAVGAETRPKAFVVITAIKY